MVLSFPIFFVGFMGCGKSKISKRLSTRYSLPYLDLDDLIVEHVGCSIREYVDKNGEEAFRIIERQLLQKKFEDFKGFVGLGGGAPCYKDNMDILLKLGTVVYLKYPSKTLQQRLVGKKEKRPLIANIPDEELEAWIINKLAEREGYYSRAQLTFDFEVDKDAYSFMLSKLG